MIDALRSISGRYKGIGRWLIWSSILLVCALALYSSPCYAQDEPDDVNMERTLIFNSLITDNDTLAVVTYDISFALEQDSAVDDAFIFAFLTTDNETLGTIIGNSVYNQGYGLGVVSFYFEPDIITSGNVYTLRIIENPEVYSTPQYWDFVIGESEYSDETDQPLALKAEIVDSAKELTPLFGVDLYDINESGSTVLSTYGELYYLQVVPGLQVMAPALFAVQTESPDYTKRSWSFTFADTLKTKYTGTFIEEFMTGYAGLFSMESSAAMNVLSVILFVVLMGLAVWKFKATALSATMDGYAFLLLLMLMGFFDMMWAGFMAFASVVLGGVILFLNKS